MTPTCSVAGCDDPHNAFGLCRRHYQRRRRGKVLDAPFVNELTVEQRFWRFVPNRPEGECWEWAGGRAAPGYGIFCVDGRQVRATRFVLGGVIGRPLTPDEHACHRCDNPPCVNPDHLFVGNRSDNMRDCVTKGRHWSQTVPERANRGTSQWAAVLAEADVLTIRDRVARGETHRSVAEDFGVSRSHVSSIVRREAWGWL